LNLAEKILAGNTGKKVVRPGEFLNVKVNLVMTTDATGLLSVRQFKKMGGKRVFDPLKVVFVIDHFVPCRDVESSKTVKVLREFAFDQGLIWYDVGRAGICHILLHEKGLVLPGDVVVGGDSHTCTYGALGAFGTGMGSTDIAAAMATGYTWILVPPSIKLTYHGHPKKWAGGKDLILFTISQIGVDGATYSSMEFHGEGINALDLDNRFTMANMTVEAGAKVGLFPVDNRVIEYINSRTNRPYNIYTADPDAEYVQTIDFEISSLEPQVSFPHSPANAKSIDQIGDIEVDQAVIGSCTNGRLSDLRAAAEVLNGRKIHPRMRCIIIPGTQEIYRNAIHERLIDIFIEAGAVVIPPTCGPCSGGHMGAIGPGERCISSTNRNFMGRMGSPEAEIYLANPAVVAASAITGRITHPREVVKR